MQSRTTRAFQMFGTTAIGLIAFKRLFSDGCQTIKFIEQKCFNKYKHRMYHKLPERLSNMTLQEGYKRRKRDWEYYIHSDVRVLATFLLSDRREISVELRSCVATRF